MQLGIVQQEKRFDACSETISRYQRKGSNLHFLPPPRGSVSQREPSHVRPQPFENIAILPPLLSHSFFIHHPILQLTVHNQRTIVAGQMWCNTPEQQHAVTVAVAQKISIPHRSIGCVVHHRQDHHVSLLLEANIDFGGTRQFQWWRRDSSRLRQPSKMFSFRHGHRRQSSHFWFCFRSRLVQQNAWDLARQ